MTQLLSLCSPTKEASAMRSHNRRVVPSLQLEKKARSNEDSAQPKINKEVKLDIYILKTHTHTKIESENRHI